MTETHTPHRMTTTPTRPTAALAYASTVAAVAAVAGAGSICRSRWCTSGRIRRSVTPALHLTPTNIEKGRTNVR